MSTTANDLLRAVLTNPECDTTRLLYADRVQEDGDDDRAELIRVQIELAKDYSPEVPDIVRQYELTEPGKKRWGRLETLVRTERDLLTKHPYKPAVTWSRGFIDTITLPADVWINNHEKLYWRDGQTDKCPHDCKWGWHENSGSSGDWKCKMCSKGYVPRPCPDTAMPLVKVIITTSPARHHIHEHPTEIRGMVSWIIDHAWLDPGVDGRYMMERHWVQQNLETGCKARWPGVDFEFRDRPWETFVDPRVDVVRWNGTRIVPGPLVNYPQAIQVDPNRSE